MPPKKAKIKKKWDLAKLENRFLILTFLGAFCHQDNLLFWNQPKILDFWYPKWPIER